MKMASLVALSSALFGTVLAVVLSGSLAACSGKDTSRSITADAAEGSKSPVADLSVLDQRYREGDDARRRSLSPEQLHADDAARAAVGAPPGLQVSISRFRNVDEIRGWRMQLESRGSDPVAAAAAFLEDVAAALGVTNIGESLEATVERSPDNTIVVRYAQRARGLPVYEAQAVVTLDARLRITHFMGSVVPDVWLPSPVPALAREDAIARALESAGATEAAAAELGYLPPARLRGYADPTAVRLAWRVQLDAPASDVFVDAHDGTILATSSRLANARHNEVFYTNWASSPNYMLESDDVCHMPGQEFWLPNGCPYAVCAQPSTPCSNPSLPWPGTSSLVKQNVDALYNFYWTQVQRDSWDGLGGVVTTYADYYSAAECNATAVLATPAGMFLGSNEAGLDTVGHEWTHLVDYKHAKLWNTKKWLAEGISDILGEYAQAWNSGGNTDWLVASMPGSDATCFTKRYLKSPPTYSDPIHGPSPDHWSDYKSNGEAHWNGTIVGKIGYLMGRPANEGSVEHGLVLSTGFGQASATKLWYQALTACIPSNATFLQLRDCLVTKACNFGLNECTQTARAVDAIGAWRPAIQPGWSASEEVSVVKRADGSRLVFYRAPGSAAVYYRKAMAATPYTWSAPVALGINMVAAPAAALHTSTGNVWVCGPTAVNNAVACASVASNDAISNIAVPASVTTDMRVSLANLGFYMYIARKQPGPGAQPVRWIRWGTAAQWSGDFALPAPTATTGAPVLASPDEDSYSPDTSKGIWFVYPVTTGSGPRIASRNYNAETNVWAAEQFTGRADETPSASGNLSAAFWHGRLHIAADDGAGTAYHMSSDVAANTWTRWVAQEFIVGPGVTLDAENAQLELWHATSAGGALAYRAKVGL